MNNYFGSRLISNSALEMEKSIEINLLFEGNKGKNIHYKYFLADEDERKENLLILYENIRMKRLSTAFGVFIIYNISKSILWRFGYFAYFFFHTRLMSPFILISSIYFINKNFVANLTNDEIIRYHLKREKKGAAEMAVEQKQLRDELLNLKMNRKKN